MSVVRPVGDRVLVRVAKLPETTAGGIHLPQNARVTPTDAEVLAIGPKVTKDILKPGDKVLFAKHAGTEVEYDNEKYLLLRESDILGVYE